MLASSSSNARFFPVPKLCPSCARLKTALVGKAALAIVSLRAHPEGTCLGIGREHGPGAIEEYLLSRTISIDLAEELSLEIVPGVQRVAPPF